MKGVFLGLLITGLVLSCTRSGGPSRPTQFDLEMQDRIDKMNELTQLWTQIRQWRGEMELELDPVASTMFEVKAKSVKEVRTVCAENRKIPNGCEEKCTLSGHICENAERICKIADELGKHDRAQQKCTSAKASCREGKKKCCGCRPSEPAPLPAGTP